MSEKTSLSESSKLTLESIVRRMRKNYIKLLDNPEFTYQDFLEAGGYSSWYVYYDLLTILKELKSEIDIEEYLSYHKEINNLYEKRWREHEKISSRG